MWLETVIADASAHLLTSRPALDYLAQRHTTLDAAVANKLGWLPADYVVPSCTREFAHYQEHKLRERLIFPLYDLLGRPVGLQTRSPTEKSYEQFTTSPGALRLFGLPLAIDAIWETEVVILVEGPFDCLAIQALLGRGAPVVASLTADIPRAAREFCWRFATTVIALLDTDAGGAAGVGKLIKSLPAGMVVTPWYPAHDPDDLVHRSGVLWRGVQSRLQGLIAERSALAARSSSPRPTTNP